LVFDSQKPQLPPYQVNRIDDRLIVSLGNIPQPSEPQIYVQEKLTKGAAATASKAQAEGRSKPGNPSTLTSIDFKQMDDKSRIVLSLSTEDPQFEASAPSKNIIAVEVKNAFAPKHLLRRLDTSAFGSVVSYIELKNVRVGKANDIRISVKLREEAPYETSKEGKEIFIDIKEKAKKIEAKVEPPLPEVKKEEPAAEAKKEEVKKEEKPAPELKKEEMKAEEKPALPAPPTPVAKKVEEGKKTVEEWPSQ
jgi:hypothetical protein